jgi:hypothetical protein
MRRSFCMLLTISRAEEELRLYICSIEKSPLKKIKYQFVALVAFCNQMFERNLLHLIDLTHLDLKRCDSYNISEEKHSQHWQKTTSCV